MRASFPDRELPADATLWHLCWQAAVGRDFLGHPSLPVRIRYRLIDAHETQGRVLVDYLIVPTEIHVVCALPAGDTPGKVARAVGNVIGRWVREAQPVRSPVLAGPHRAVRIGSLEQLREQVRLLAWRPVHLHLCRTPTHHSHGSVRIALGVSVAQGFNCWPLLSLFGDTVQGARAALRRWLTGRPTADAMRYWELSCGLALATGNVGPRSAMVRELRSPGAVALVTAAGAAGIDGALALLGAWVGAKLGANGGVDLQARGGSAASRARALVACLAVDHGLCSAASVARHFGRAKSTLSEQMAASRRRASDQAILRTPMARIVEEGQALRAQAEVRDRQRADGGVDAQARHEGAGA